MLLAPLPALVVGVIVMRRHDVSPLLWGQQLGAGLLLMFFCVGGIVALHRAPRSTPRALAIVAIAALLLLTATLLTPGVEGVRRWVSIGPLQLNAAFVTLPILLIVFGGIVRGDVASSTTWLVRSAVLIAAAVLVLQPDGSQATAFAVALAVLLLQRTTAIHDWLVAAIVVISAIISWSRPDPLDAVPYVEGIVGLAASDGPMWLIAALVALVLLPIPFLADAATRHAGYRVSLALAAYFAAASIVSFVKPYPVPLLGFGLSPILGYFVALGWVIAQRERPPRRV
jgi:cell division protein FtsW (lipid II flippase)